MPVMLQNRIKERGLRQAALADACGVTDATMSRWLTGKIKIPAERVAKVAEITGLAPHDLRPDVFPEPASAGHDGTESSCAAHGSATEAA